MSSLKSPPPHIRALGFGLGRQLNGLTVFAPAREIPCIGKSQAVHWLHGLEFADIKPLQKNAFAIWFVDDGESVSPRIQPSVVLHEFVLRDAEKFGDGMCLRVRDVHITGPAAAVSAALALIPGLVGSGGVSFWHFGFSVRSSYRVIP